MEFGEILANAIPTADGMRVPVPADWHQGRTTYGGFTSALALEIALQVGGELPPLRSAQISMIAPLHTEIEARARVMRRGRNVTWVSAELVPADNPDIVALTSCFVFMSPVESVANMEAPPPPGELLPRGAAPALDFQGWPVFLKAHFDIRDALPPPPEPKPQQSWWARAHDRSGLHPMVELLLVADALPTGVTALVKRGTPMSSMQWQVNMLDPAPSTPDGWWLMHSAGECAGDGFSSERMMMWNSAGEPVLAATQSVALFG